MPVVDPPQASRSSLPYARLSGYYFFYFAFVGVASPYFGQYLKSLGFSAWELSVLLSQMQLMRVLAPNAWAWLADHGVAGRVGIIRVAGAASVLACTAFFFVDGFFGWLLAIAVLSFFWSAALPLFEGVTFDHLRATGGDYSRVRLWGSIGFIVTVQGAGWLLDRLPLSSVPWMLAATSFGILVFAMLVQEPRQRAAAESPASLRSVLAEARVRALLASAFAMAFAHGALYLFYSIYLAAHGYSQTVIGALWSLGVVAEILVFMKIGEILRRHPVRSVLLACFAAAAFRFVMIAGGVGSLPLLIFAQVLHALTFGAFHAACIHAVNHWFPHGCQGRGQALYSSLSFGLGGLLGGLLAGAVWDLLGGASAYLISAAAAALGGFVAIRWLPRR
jgi:MFS transporter, PPP family, 3-phenylpropionic acid transporter